MSRPFFISDLHLDHKNILKFAGKYRKGSDILEHDEWLIDLINSRVERNDVLYILGDLAFSPEGLVRVGCGINCQMKVILGNHDKYPIDDYLKYFQVIPGLLAYKGFWLSHAPIHPAELRGRKNIHGHVHHQSIQDPNYINVCVENCPDGPISLDELLVISASNEIYSGMRLSNNSIG